MRRQPVQFERLDMGEWPGLGEAGNRRNGCMCSKIEEKLLRGEQPLPAIAQRDLDRPWLDEARIAHDEFRTRRLIAFEMKRHEAFDHGALARHNRLHVDRDRAGRNAIFPGTDNAMSNARAPDLVLAGQAVDIGTRAPDPAPLDDGYLLAGLRQIPGEVFTTLAATDHDGVVALRFHRQLSILLSSHGLEMGRDQGV